MSTLESVESAVHDADLVIGAVLVPGAATPKVVTRKMVAEMRPGSVLVDVSIDQGGCFETSRPTTHADPVYTVDGVIHYCVANMPGSVPRTAAFALNNATLPFVMALADHGASVAMARDPNLLAGLNVHHGRITHRAVAKSLGLEFLDPREAIRA
jgi:alanine dehydrogenase